MTQDTNPYQPPKSHVPLREEVRAMIPAGKGRRFGTLLIDYAAFLGITFCLGFFSVLAFGQEGLKTIQEIPDFVLGCTLMTAYYIVFEGFWGRTLGKLLCGTVVVNESGGKPSFAQVIGRTLCRFIPFEPFSCLGERGWHDSLSNTHVVLARSA